MIRKSIAYLFLLSVNPLAIADKEMQLHDPTRPLNALQQKVAKKDGKFDLQGVYRFEQDLFAIVNDKKVLLGDSIDGGVIKSLDSQRVVIEFEGNLLELTMREKILIQNGKRP